MRTLVTPLYSTTLFSTQVLPYGCRVALKTYESESCVAVSVDLCTRGGVRPHNPLCNGVRRGVLNILRRSNGILKDLNIEDSYADILRTPVLITPLMGTRLARI